MKNGHLKIDKGIPLPAPRGGGIADMLRQMKKGDSFFSETIVASLSARAKQAGLDGKFSQRSVEGGYRVWRIS